MFTAISQTLFTPPLHTHIRVALKGKIILDFWLKNIEK